MASLDVAERVPYPSESGARPGEEELCIPSLKGVWLVWAASCALLWLLLGNRPSSATLLWAVSGLVLSLLGALLLSGRYPRMGSLVLLGGVTATVLVAAAVSHMPLPLMYLSVPVLAAGALLGPMVSLLWAGLTMALVLGAGFGGEIPAHSLFLLALVGLTAWAGFGPQRSLLFVAWDRGTTAEALMDRLRRERGELNKTIKSLDLSYQLLEKTNRELAIARREADVLRDLRNRFATNVSHELRTPLNIVLGFANVIYRNPQLYGLDRWPDALLRDLAQIQRNARHLSQLVDDVIDLARVDALAMPIRRERAQIEAVIQEAVESVASMAEEKGLQLDVACQEGLPEVSMDRLRIRQVLYNLLSNAVRYTDQGRVSVQARYDRSELVVSVSDTGRGIPAAELADIFDEFYQVGRPKTGPEAGKGLGLAIARRLVQLHGGRIWAESEVGRGSTFHFTLPLSGVTVSRLKAPIGPPPVRRRLAPTVLVLSQDDSAALYLSRRVEGYHFRHADCLDAAEVALEESRAMAVVVDDSLGISPSEVRHRLGTCGCPSVPVVGCPLPSTRWISGGDDFAAVITKPITSEGLLKVLDQVLPEAEANSRPRLLLVDDDRGFVELVKRLLQVAGRDYLTEGAYTGREALRKMARARPACVLLDLVLPEMNGFEVAAAMREDPGLGQVPVIAITAATPGEDNLATQGATLTLALPDRFRPGELAALLSAILELASERSPTPDNGAEPEVALPARSV
ncbi:MAG: hybrid sensor histidine kinase/response regulator [Anaerolineae bacterium]|nr:hybrid sensor histidine kinase/response regulator [Anaerolineae bacterium]